MLQCTCLTRSPSTLISASTRLCFCRRSSTPMRCFPKSSDRSLSFNSSILSRIYDISCTERQGSRDNYITELMNKLNNKPTTKCLNEQMNNRPKMHYDQMTQLPDDQMTGSHGPLTQGWLNDPRLPQWPQNDPRMTPKWPNNDQITQNWPNDLMIEWPKTDPMNQRQNDPRLNIDQWPKNDPRITKMTQKIT